MVFKHKQHLLPPRQIFKPLTLPQRQTSQENCHV